MNIQLTLALRYLGGRKLRTALTTLAIMFGVLVIFGMNSLLPTFVNAFQANAMAMSGQVDATITNKTGEAFPEAVAEKVANVPGVRAVSATLTRGITLPPDYFDHDPATPDQVSGVNLVGADPEAIRTVSSFQILQGRFLQKEDGAAAVIAQSLAEDAGIGLGDKLRLPTAIGATDLTIVGILPQRLLPGNEEVLVNLPEAQKLLATPGKVNTIDADFDTMDKTRRAEIESNIEAVLGDSFSIGTIQEGAELLNNIRIAQSIFVVLGVLALLMGGFIIFNTFRTIIAERRRDIGMLRAVGASQRTITSLILLEGVIQGVIGTIAGILLGYAFAWLVLSAATSAIRQFINIPASSVPVIPGLVVLSILIGVGTTLLAGLLPAISASRITPLEALRPSVGATTFRRLSGAGFWVGLVMIILAIAGLFSNTISLIGPGSVLFIIGLLLVSPALVYPIANLFAGLIAALFARDGTAQLAGGNLSRQPTRSAVTASTTMIALAILLMAASVVSSVTLTFQDMLKKSLSSDFLIIPPSVTTWGLNVGASPALADELRAVNGVSVVSSLRFAGTKIGNLAVGLLGIDPRAYQQTSGLTFVAGDPETAFQEMESGRGMIVNGIFASTVGVKLGDTVKLLTPTGEVEYRIVGIASDYLNAKTTTGYISQANIAADFGSNQDVFYQINLVKDANPAAVEAAFKDILKPYPQFKLVSGQAYLQQNTSLLSNLFFGMDLMVIFLAIPSLIAMVNTLAIGVLERRREIGMLRAVGATRRQVGKMILAEALILAAIGTAFGLLSGLYLGYMAVVAFSAFGFPATYIFPASGVILAVASGLLFGALAAVIPARQATGLTVVSALRYE